MVPHACSACHIGTGHQLCHLRGDLPQDLEAQIGSFDKDRGKRLKAAQTKLARAKTGLEAARKQLKERQGQASQATAEMEAAEGERAALQQQLQAAEAALTGP